MKQIGKGVFGRVLYDERRDVAVKESLCTSMSFGVPDDMIGEVDVLKLLRRVPGVVSLLGVETSERQLKLALEPCRCDVRTWMRDTPTTDRVRQCELLIGSIGDALSAMHHVGIVHGDVKASNILVDRHGAFRLADFGKSRPVALAPEYVSNALRYKPPTQDPVLADWWALMVVVSNALIGELVVDSSTLNILATVDSRVRVPAKCRAFIRAASNLSYKHEPTPGLVDAVVCELPLRVPEHPLVASVASVRQRCGPVSDAMFVHLLSSFLYRVPAVPVVDLFAYAEVALVLASRWVPVSENGGRIRLRHVPDHAAFCVFQQRFLNAIGYRINFHTENGFSAAVHEQGGAPAIRRRLAQP